MNLVIGSGPAGVACAHALLDRGVPVTLIDGGVSLDADRQAMVRRLAAASPAEWSPADVSRLTEGMNLRAGGVPLKRAFGSTFAFDDARESMPIRSRGAEIWSSLAVGGLSHVWGATVLPYRAEDFRAWPFGLATLAPHYAAIARWMTVAAVPDALTPEFPIHAEAAQSLQPSRQAEALLAHGRQHAEALERSGLRVGRSRLAVRAEPSGAGDAGCCLCGKCLYGCPYGAIYNAADTLAHLKQRPGFHHAPGFVVRRIVEHSDGVRVEADVRGSAQPQVFAGVRVYLAAGTLASTRIVLASLEAFDQEVTLRDSLYFAVPMVMHARVTDADREAVHTLSQVFVELAAADASPYNVHLQVYGYNDMLPQLPVVRWLPAAARRAALNRLLVAQGYLHSRESPTVSVRLARGEGSASPTLMLEARGAEAGRARVRRVVRALSRRRQWLGATPVTMLTQVPPPGRGYHTGGTLPMRERPAAFETDDAGRPYGLARTHVVDASVFPEIPSGPITYSVMANAHRIGAMAW